MEPVINQTLMLKALLSKFTQILYLDSKELELMHTYIFSDGYALPISEDSEIYETLIYLKDIACENGLTKIEDICSYFDQETNELITLVQPFISLDDKNPTAFSHPDFHFLNNTIKVSSIKLLPCTKTQSWSYRDLLENIYQHLLNSNVLKQEQDYRAFNIFNHCWGKLSTHSCGPLHLKIAIDSDHYYFKHYMESFSTSKKPVSKLIRCIKYIKFVRTLFLGGTLKNIGKYFFHSYMQNRKVKILYKQLFDMIKAEKPIYSEGIKMHLSKMMLISKWGNTNFRKSIVSSPDDGSLMISDWAAYEKTNVFATELYKKQFSRKKWAILKSPEGHSWITSDNPGFSIDIKPILKGAEQARPDPLWKTISIDSTVYFPLSNQYCLRLQPIFDKLMTSDSDSRHGISFELSSEAELTVVNSMVFSSKPEVVISKEKGILLHCKENVE